MATAAPQTARKPSTSELKILATPSGASSARLGVASHLSTQSLTSVKSNAFTLGSPLRSSGGNSTTALKPTFITQRPGLGDSNTSLVQNSVQGSPSNLQTQSQYFENPKVVAMPTWDEDKGRFTSLKLPFQMESQSIFQQAMQREAPKVLQRLTPAVTSFLASPACEEMFHTTFWLFLIQIRQKLFQQKHQQHRRSSLSIDGGLDLGETERKERELVRSRELELLEEEKATERILYHHLADVYGQSFTNTSLSIQGYEMEAKDAIFEQWPTLCSRFIYYTYTQLFPNEVDTGLFNRRFRKELATTLTYWMTGVQFQRLDLGNWPKADPVRFIRRSSNSTSVSHKPGAQGQNRASADLFGAEQSLSGLSAFPSLAKQQKEEGATPLRGKGHRGSFSKTLGSSDSFDPSQSQSQPDGPQSDGSKRKKRGDSVSKRGSIASGQKQNEPEPLKNRTKSIVTREIQDALADAETQADQALLRKRSQKRSFRKSTLLTSSTTQKSDKDVAAVSFANEIRGKRKRRGREKIVPTLQSGQGAVWYEQGKLIGHLSQERRLEFGLDQNHSARSTVAVGQPKEPGCALPPLNQLRLPRFDVTAKRNTAAAPTSHTPRDRREEIFVRELILPKHSPLMQYYMDNILKMDAPRLNQKPIHQTVLSDIDRAGAQVVFAAKAKASLALGDEAVRAIQKAQQNMTMIESNDQAAVARVQKIATRRAEYARQVLNVASSPRNEYRVTVEERCETLIREALKEGGKEIPDIIAFYEKAVQQFKEDMMDMTTAKRNELGNLCMKCKVRMLTLQRRAPHVFNRKEHDLGPAASDALSEMMDRIDVEEDTKKLPDVEYLGVLDTLPQLKRRKSRWPSKRKSTLGGPNNGGKSFSVVTSVGDGEKSVSNKERSMSKSFFEVRMERQRMLQLQERRNQMSFDLDKMIDVALNADKRKSSAFNEESEREMEEPILDLEQSQTEIHKATAMAKEMLRFLSANNQDPATDSRSGSQSPQRSSTRDPITATTAHNTLKATHRLSYSSDPSAGKADLVGVAKTSRDLPTTAVAAPSLPAATLTRRDSNSFMRRAVSPPTRTPRGDKGQGLPPLALSTLTSPAEEVSPTSMTSPQGGDEPPFLYPTPPPSREAVEPQFHLRHVASPSGAVSVATPQRVHHRISAKLGSPRMLHFSERTSAVTVLSPHRPQ